MASDIDHEAAVFRVLGERAPEDRVVAVGRPWVTARRRAGFMVLGNAPR